MSTIVREGKDAAAPLLPELATVTGIIPETPGINTYRIVFDDPEVMRNFSFQPGQIGQLSVLGVGESTFAISSPPSCKEYIQFSVMKAGVVTTAIHELSEGDRVGVRAPMGRPFPAEEWQGKDILVLAGGIGIAPLRSLFLHLLDHLDSYGRLTLIYGARTPVDLCFDDDRRRWERHDSVDFTATIDSAASGWEGCVGLVPEVLEESAPSPENAVAVTCGPPIMIRYTLQSLERLGFVEEQIYTTLERRMKCGIGLCGRCNVGSRYVCTDGPVFSLAELRRLPDEL